MYNIYIIYIDPHVKGCCFPQQMARSSKRTAQRTDSGLRLHRAAALWSFSLDPHPFGVETPLPQLSCIILSRCRSRCRCKSRCI